MDICVWILAKAGDALLNRSYTRGLRRKDNDDKAPPSKRDWALASSYIHHDGVPS